MRESYHRPAGNPIRYDRLPATRPQLAMIPRAAERPGMWQEHVHQVVTILILGAVPLLLYRAPGWNWLEPYDLLFAVPTVVLCLWLSIHQRQVSYLLNPVFLLALVLLVINHRTPWRAQVILLALSASALTYAFGRHWLDFCTAAPMPWKLATQLRRECSHELLFMAARLGVLLAGVFLVDWLLLRMVLLAIPLAALVQPRRTDHNVSYWRVIGHSLSSWFTYRAAKAPGLWQSPVGDMRQRFALTFFVAVLMAILLSRWENSPLLSIVSWARHQHEMLALQLEVQDASGFARLRHLGLVWLLAGIAILVLPAGIPLVLAVSASMSILQYGATLRQWAGSKHSVIDVCLSLRESRDPIERTSLFVGRVVDDGSPVLVPRKVYQEHVHGLGNSGSGKTSLFLCPTIEQLVMPGDASLIVLDLKADTLELLASLIAAAEVCREKIGITLPLKVFSNQRNRATFAFNPMTQPYWSQLDTLTRTNILCAALGLIHGTDYGKSWFTDAVMAVLHHTLKTYPHTRTFRELAEHIGIVVTSAKKKDLHPEVREAGVHIHEIVKRLAECEALNVAQGTGHDQEVLEEMIDLEQVFQTPQLMYFHLPSTISPSAAPEIARLVTYLLLAAATQTDRKHQVFLVIDEFQRMVAGNLENILQLARSMGIGIILANQSLADLQRSGTDLIPAIEANCRMRTWLAVSSSEDRERLIRDSGMTVDFKHSYTLSQDHNGHVAQSRTISEEIRPRMDANDILDATDHAFRHILLIARGEGYAQYGGLPLLCETEYHISEEEYERRRKLEWPQLPGTFFPKPELDEGHDDSDDSMPLGAKPHKPRPSGPAWSADVIGQSVEPGSSPPDAAQSLQSLFAELEKKQAAPPPKRRRKEP